jgi:hypothetical protein
MSAPMKFAKEMIAAGYRTWSQVQKAGHKNISNEARDEFRRLAEAANAEDEEKRRASGAAQRQARSQPEAVAARREKHEKLIADQQAARRAKLKDTPPDEPG